MEKKGFEQDIPSHIVEEIEDLVCDNLFVADSIFGGVLTLNRSSLEYEVGLSFFKYYE